ncbi:MAG: zinc-ribbon domain-containing protein [Desulfobacterales bacterium]
MEIICKSCEARFRLPDDKLPAGKTVNIPCPKCKQPITVGPPDPESDPDRKTPENEGYDPSERPFDFIEEEGKTALICEPDPAVRDALSKTLALMDYYVRDAESTREALKQMRYHNFDLVLVNERFDAHNPDVNGVLVFLERLAMAVRRNIFVVLISDRYRTLDHMTAFNRSVNLTLNAQDIPNLEKILNKSIADHEYFYRAFKDALRDAGNF